MKTYSKTKEEFKPKRDENSNSRLFSSFKEIKINSNNKWSSLIIVIFSFVLSYILIGQDNSKILIIDIISVILNAEIAIFGCIFAVYAIIISLISDDYMKRLADIYSDKKDSYLKIGVRYFNNILFLYFVGMSISLLAIILLKAINNLNSLSAIGRYFYMRFFYIIAIGGYFSYSIRILYEIKSVIFNAMFFLEMKIIYRFCDFENEEKENK